MYVDQKSLLKETGMFGHNLFMRHGTSSFKLVLKMEVICHGNGDFIALLFFVHYKLCVLWS